MGVPEPSVDSLSLSFSLLSLVVCSGVVWGEVCVVWGAGAGVGVRVEADASTPCVMMNKSVSVCTKTACSMALAHPVFISWYGTDKI